MAAKGNASLPISSEYLHAPLEHHEEGATVTDCGIETLFDSQQKSDFYL